MKQIEFAYFHSVRNVWRMQLNILFFYCFAAGYHWYYLLLWSICALVICLLQNNYWTFFFVFLLYCCWNSEPIKCRIENINDLHFNYVLELLKYECARAINQNTMATLVVSLMYCVNTDAGLEAICNWFLAISSFYIAETFVHFK